VKPHAKIINRILEQLQPAKTVGVVGHVRPDGDCIGSQLALAFALKNEGKTVCCWNEERTPQKLAFLDPEKVLQRPKPGYQFDCVVAIDSASLERLGKVEQYVQARRCLINIDHHVSNTRFGDLNWVSKRDASTGELVFRLLRTANWHITPPIADALFTAVSTDTGSFQYPSTRPSTFAVAGELVRRGADLARICHEVFQSQSLSRVRLLKHVYDSYRLICENQIAYFWLRPADYRRAGADPADTEGLIDHIRAIEPVVVACVFEELEPDLVRISLRSKSQRVNVNEIAARFGGGGHPAAAGARIRGRPLSVQRRVISALREALAAAA
jgi:phosphoesterase RecJ-like protein